MSHQHKVKMARKMLTRKEKEDHTPIFQSEAWDARKKQRLEKQLEEMHYANKNIPPEKREAYQKAWERQLAEINAIPEEEKKKKGNVRKWKKNQKNKLKEKFGIKKRK